MSQKKIAKRKNTDTNKKNQIFIIRINTVATFPISLYKGGN